LVPTPTEVEILTIILCVHGLSSKEYLENSEVLRDLELFCPLCLAENVRRRLARNGWYPRRIPDEATWQPGRAYRKKCSRCKVSFTLLPDFVLEDRSYGKGVVADWLWLALQGEPCRSRRFYEEQGLLAELAEPADPQTAEPLDPLLSWTDEVDTRNRPLRPCPSLLNRWLRASVVASRAWLPLLVTACVAVGCDLRHRLGVGLEALTAVPERAYPLALALGCLAWLRGEPEIRGVLGGLLELLGRSPPASHSLQRAQFPASPYDTVDLDLRAPPAWAEAIRTRGGLEI
jgi:hypothetical protein